MDKNFILDIVDSKKQSEIAKTIILLAHSMDLEVVAEGVETEFILNILKEYGCDKAQGYLFSVPLHPDYVEKYLNDNH